VQAAQVRSRCDDKDIVEDGAFPKGYKQKMQHLQREVDKQKELLEWYKSAEQTQSRSFTIAEPPQIDRAITEFINMASHRTTRYKECIHRSHDLARQYRLAVEQQAEQIDQLEHQLYVTRGRAFRKLHETEAKWVQVLIDNAQWLSANLEAGEKTLKYAWDRVGELESIVATQNHQIVELQRQAQSLQESWTQDRISLTQTESEVHRLQALVRHLQLLIQVNSPLGMVEDSDHLQ